MLLFGDDYYYYQFKNERTPREGISVYSTGHFYGGSNTLQPQIYLGFYPVTRKYIYLVSPFLSLVGSELYEALLLTFAFIKYYIGTMYQ